MGNKYELKRKKGISGPYQKEDLVEMLAGLKIGKKTPCRPINSGEDFKALIKVIPEVVKIVEDRRSVNSKRTIEQYNLSNEVILTTETVIPAEWEIEERLGIVTAEIAFGMNVFRDVFTNVRDIVGGKSISTVKVLKDLKTNAFQDLKMQSLDIGANAIVGVSFNYNEFSGNGRGMLLLVVTGTAVRIKQDE